jgi:hypothetical protein
MWHLEIKGRYATMEKVGGCGIYKWPPPNRFGLVALPCPIGPSLSVRLGEVRNWGTRILPLSGTLGPSSRFNSLYHIPIHGVGVVYARNIRRTTLPLKIKNLHLQIRSWPLAIWWPNPHKACPYRSCGICRQQENVANIFFQLWPCLVYVEQYVHEMLQSLPDLFAIFKRLSGKTTIFLCGFTLRLNTGCYEIYAISLLLKLIFLIDC